MKRVKLNKSGNPKSVRNCKLCIVLSEGKGSKWYWIPDGQDKFSVDKNTYFIIDDGVYIYNGIRVLIYMEGISTPISHSLIDREEITKEITDSKGKKRKIKIQKIKGLKFDSKLIDMLLNRNLADEFTKEHMDLPNLVLLILLVVTVAVGFINIGMWFM